MVFKYIILLINAAIFFIISNAFVTSGCYTHNSVVFCVGVLLLGLSVINFVAVVIEE